MWARFKYREFFDVPHDIFAEVRGESLYLSSAFDEVIDDYASSYEVYIMPKDFDPPTGSWVGVENLAQRKLGAVPIGEIEFDESKRTHLNADRLLELLD